MVHPTKKTGYQCGYKHAGHASSRNGANKNVSRELQVAYWTISTIGGM